jgi:hypothetical protein
MSASHRRTTSRSRQPAARTTARMRPRTATLLLAAVLIVAALVAACSAQATVGSAGSVSPSSAGASPTAAAASGGASATASGGADWTRVLKILAFMKGAPPAKPVVVLLGGSAARESTVSDADWRRQIEQAGGPATLAWNLGSRNRTLAQNVAIVKALPKGPTIVYIGINLGSFTSTQKTASISIPSPTSTPPSLQQPHQYTKGRILTTARKKALVGEWLADRYPVFKRSFPASAGVLATLIQTCKDRGFYPVLFELPRDTPVIGGELNAPTTRYRDTCVALSKKHDVPWVSFVSRAKLPNSSFYDLWHLVEPGRAVWQKLLSAETAEILNGDAFSGGGS